MNTIKAAKITCEVNKSLAGELTETLRKHAVEHLHVHSRRSLVLHERAAFSFLPPTTGLDEDPAEVMELYVPQDKAEMILKSLARDLNLATPGRGSVYAEEIELRSPEGMEFNNMRISGAAGSGGDEPLASRLASISCIVQRGQGNSIAMHALESGTSVPAISFGIGTGLRNKLGLIRITIPAEKELVTVIVSEHDRDEIMNSLIEAGRLDQPGRGFIGTSPVAFGIINSKTFRGKQRHSASMEQVISAIDQLKAGTEWRKKTASIKDKSGMYLKKTYLTDMLSMTMICNEGRAGDLVNTAMAAGAGGATISKITYSTLAAAGHGVSPARESVSMGILPKSLESIMKAVDAEGAFKADTACIVEIKPMPKACTYLGKK